MQKICKGHYRDADKGFDVYRVRSREYRNLFRKDGTSSPSYSWVETWSLRWLNVQAPYNLCHGFTTKAQAVKHGIEGQ